MQPYRERGLDRDSVFYNMLRVMRVAYQRFRTTGTGNPPQFSQQDIRKAELEWARLKKSYDSTIYPFATDLSSCFLGSTSRKRIVLVVDGVFYGDTNVPGVIGYDITDDIHEFFHTAQQRGTIDDYITGRKVAEFVEQERSSLANKGFRFFEIRASKFFFFNEEDLGSDVFMTRDGINLETLLPLVTDVYVPLNLKGGLGHVNANPVEQPSLENYLRNIPRFVSYRLKASTGGKLAKTLVQDEQITLEDSIKDIAAHRVIAMDRDEVHRAVEVMGGIPTIGRSRIVAIGRHQVKVLAVDDHYKKPESQYKGINLLVETAETSRKGLKAPTAREIQLIEKSKHFNHEIDAENDKNPAFRRRYERKKTSSQQTNQFYERYRKLLERICGSEYMLVPI